MKVVKCEMGHLDKVTELYDKATFYLEKNVNYPKWTHGVYPGRESVKLAILNGIQYMCTEDGKVVGAFILNKDPQGKYENGEWRVELTEGEYLVIHTLAVDPGIYNRGTGKFMVEFCVEEAVKNGYKGIRLDVVPDNVPARRLYEKMNFLFAGEVDLERGIREIPKFALYELNF